MKRIAIQGIKGSFHDIAAHHFFAGEEIELVCCNTFEEMFARLKDSPDMLGLMAIENTIAGSLLHNYELLRDSGMTIVGEHKLRRTSRWSKWRTLQALLLTSAGSRGTDMLPSAIRMLPKSTA